MKLLGLNNWMDLPNKLHFKAVPCCLLTAGTIPASAKWITSHS